MASSLVSKVASLRRRATGFLSPYKATNNILLDDKRWRSRGSSDLLGYCKFHGICSSSGGFQDDDTYNTSICKEEFEVGSHLVSYTTPIYDKKRVISGTFGQSRILGNRVVSVAGREVVMDIGKTKVSSLAQAEEQGFSASEGKHLEILYEEDKFLDAQMKIQSAQQKKFPCHALMKRPSVDDIIHSSIQGLIPAGYFDDKVYSTTDVIESDGQQDPIIMAANTISASLMVSGIFWDGPIGVVRIGRMKDAEDGALVVNPTLDQIIRQGLDLNLVYACTRDKTLMIDLEASEVSNRDVITALRLAHDEALKYIEPQIRLSERSQTEKNYKLYTITDKSRGVIENKVKRLAEWQFPKATDTAMRNIGQRIIEKGLRDDGRRQEIPDKNDKRLAEWRFPKATDTAMRNIGQRMIFEKGLSDDGGQRMIIIEKGLSGDGRRLKPVWEPQYCESVLPYGSSLLWLDRTPVRSEVDLVDTRHDEYTFSEVEDSLEMFEWRPQLDFADMDGRTPKAFCAVLPPEEDFPYIVRVEIDSGFGTSYLASICGPSLALMDAGIPLKRHVAGVSMGLVSEVDPATGMIINYIVTDADGDNHQKGDMNLKVAGTRNGVTAIRLDIENPNAAAVRIGVPLNIICQCLGPARKAHLHLLEHMEHIIDVPRHSTRSFSHNGWNWPSLRGLSDMDSLWHRLKLNDKADAVAAAAAPDQELNMKSRKYCSWHVGTVHSRQLQQQLVMKRYLLQLVMKRYWSEHQEIRTRDHLSCNSSPKLM